MGLLRNKGYDRERLLKAISQAQAKGRRRKALALYEQILSVEPNNPTLHRRAAPLLARARRRKEAWKSFRIAAQALSNSGHLEKAVGIYSEAIQYLPRQTEAWMAIAEIHIERDRPSEAVKALLEGRRHLRGRGRRPDAIRLLSRALQIDPAQVSTALDLARLLRKTGERRGALRVLGQTRRWCRGAALRRLRGAEFLASPTPAALARWLAAAVLGR